MSSFWMAVIGLLSSVVLLLTACGSANIRSGDPPADVYLARPPRQVAPGKMIVQHIINQLGGDIVVITGPGGRILTDVIATGAGYSMEAARVEVGSHITVTNDGTDIEVRPWRTTSVKVRIHKFMCCFMSSCRLKPICSTFDTHAGNIEVNGNVGSVTGYDF